MIRKYHHGFTIIEMVITIVIGGIIAGMLAQFITRPIEGYIAQSRRAELVDIAETALGHITREVRQALPNSIRVACSNQCLEVLHTIDGGRYRAKAPGDRLKFTGTESTFDTLGPTSLADGILTKTLVIYNTGLTGADAYSGDNVATITTRSLAADGISDNITYTSLLPSGLFPNESPAQRFYVVDTPISYICASGVITRYHNYAITAVQPTSAPGATEGVLANKVTNCSFEYQTDTANRSGLLTASITVSDSGESITLLQQVHIVNQP